MFTDPQDAPRVIPHTRGVADHAAPTDDDLTASRVASHVATLLPAVFWLLGVYVFDGAVPLALQGAIGLLLTGLVATVTHLARRAGLTE